ncbi:MAG: PDZ domain-containing protein [Acidobacteriota bacterium]
MGALVIRVEPDSPAAAAGIALCDFLERASGEDLRQVGSLEAFTARMREAAMLAHAPLAVRKYDAVTESYSPGAVDLRLPAEVGAKAGMSLSTQILVLEVAPDSPAAQAGIEPGDFIESVNGERVPDIRSPTLIDQRVSDAALNDGVVTLTVGRWRPVPDSPEQKLAFSSRREVTVAVGSAVGG